MIDLRSVLKVELTGFANEWNGVKREMKERIPSGFFGLSQIRISWYHFLSWGGRRGTCEWACQALYSGVSEHPQEQFRGRFG